MNSLLVAHPEIRGQIWYKWENVTNRPLPMLEMFGTALKLKISWNGTGLFLRLILIGFKFLFFCTRSSHIKLVNCQESDITEGRLCSTQRNSLSWTFIKSPREALFRKLMFLIRNFALALKIDVFSWQHIDLCRYLKWLAYWSQYKPRQHSIPVKLIYLA